MKPNESEAFNALLKVAGGAYDPNPVTDYKCLAYWGALSAYSYREVKAALNKAIKSQDRFPTISQIVKEIELIRRDNPVALDKSCEMCDGIGFVSLYLKVNQQKMTELKFTGDILGNTSEMIQLGILEPATKEEYDQHKTPRIYCFSKKCECRGAM